MKNNFNDMSVSVLRNRLSKKVKVSEKFNPYKHNSELAMNTLLNNKNLDSESYVHLLSLSDECFNKELIEALKLQE